MTADALGQARLLLHKAVELRRQVQQNLQAEHFQNDDLQMQVYNSYANMAVSLFPDDPRIGEGKLVLMPDKELQFLSLAGLAASPEWVSKRLEMRLMLLINGLEVILGEPVAGGGEGQGERAQGEPSPDDRSFRFMRTPDLRDIVLADYHEAQQAFSARLYKASALLAGSVVEGMLLDAMLRQDITERDDYQRATTKLRNSQDGEIKWERVSMAMLVGVAFEMCLLSQRAKDFAGHVGDFRNTIHPYNEMTNRNRVRREEAKVLLAMIELIYRDLSRPEGVANETSATKTD